MVAKPDGRLTHDLDPNDRPPRDACGVFGVWSPGEDVAKLAYYGLHALQHRGQESAGIAVSDGRRIVVHKEMGLVAQVFDEPSLTALRGDIAVAHCRYSTTGAPVWANAQPTFRSTPTLSIALGHNGNLTNTRELAAMLPPESGFAGLQATSDTDVLTELIASGAEDAGAEAGGFGTDSGVEEAAARILPLVRGAYSLVFMDENTLYAARDPQGFRPLVIGKLAGGWVAASETAALDIVGASFVREVEPGELITLDERGMRSRRFAPAAPKVCLFEYVYLARPDTTIGGRGLHATRVEIGRRLAAEYPAVRRDLVIPVPESGTPAAIGYAEASGIPYGQGLVKNSYVGRTFIQPSQTIRQLGIRLKLNPLRDVIAGPQDRGRRRLDRARQHPAGDRGDAPRGGRARGARADRVAAGEVAVLLRHRLRDPRRAARRPLLGRGDPRGDRRGLARLRVPRRAHRGDRAARRVTLPRLLRRALPGAGRRKANAARASSNR